MKTKKFIAGLFIIALLLPAYTKAQNCDTLFLNNWTVHFNSTVFINNDTFTFPHNGLINSIYRWVHIDSIGFVDSIAFHYRGIPLSDSVEIEFDFLDTTHWGGFDWEVNIIKNDTTISFRIYGTPDCLDNFFIQIVQYVNPFIMIAPKLLIYRKTNAVKEIPLLQNQENAIKIYNILGQPIAPNTKNTMMILQDKNGNTRKKIIIQ